MLHHLGKYDRPGSKAGNMKMSNIDPNFPRMELARLKTYSN
jgi:hypothetical protein